MNSASDQIQGFGVQVIEGNLKLSQITRPEFCRNVYVCQVEKRTAKAKKNVRSSDLFNIYLFRTYVS